MQVKLGDSVKIHYKAKLKDEIIFDSNENEEPIELIVGNNKIIPAFEKAIIGMSPGETKTINLDAKNAFGPHLNELVATIDKSQLPQNILPEIGMQLQLQQPNGAAMLVTIVNVDEQSVTLDANHPLAGKDVTFDISLLEIL